MRITAIPTKEARPRAKELLEAVGLSDVDERKRPAMLSGGQQQRGAIARALASNAKCLLADEPTGNLYSENGRLVIDLLKRLNVTYSTEYSMWSKNREIAEKTEIEVEMPTMLFFVTPLCVFLF